MNTAAPLGFYAFANAQQAAVHNRLECRLEIWWDAANGVDAVEGDGPSDDKSAQNLAVI